ncbi:MAG: hypothetical protein CW338_08670, partial [Clostridiales bacterium]|nr:hypothetical protein [Clostridiales bacterium]
MKKIANRKVNIIIAAVVVVAFILVMLLRSGVFDSSPAVEVKADNCYDRTLHVITDADYSPYSFYAEDGSFSGYDVELITIIANRLHMNLDLRLMNWNDAIGAMNAEEADLLMTCDYSDSFAGVDLLMKSLPTSDDEFIVYSAREVRSVDDLYGKRIAIMKNGNVTPVVERLGLKEYCRQYDDNRTAMQALAAGEADFVIVRQAVGITLLKELDISGVDGYFSAGQSLMCYGIRDPGLKKMIDDVIVELRMSGEMERLREKWLTTFVRPYTFREVVENNLWIVFIFIVLLVLSLGAIYKSRMREAREKEEQAAKDLELNRKLEQALATAETASQYKTEFLFNMSHDIRTPMNAIMGYTDIGLRYADDPDMAKDNFRKIKTAGGHLLSLINDILEMSRIESGNLVLNEAPCDVRLSVASVEHMSKALAISKDIDFEAVMGDIPNPYIYADELHMNEILINLVSNAVKYTRNGGWVRYELRQLGGVEDGKVVYRFEIKDSGIGMTEEFQQHLFEAFTREENAAVSKTEGSG